MKWEFVSFEDGVSARGSGSSGLPQSEWEDGGKYPVIGQGAEFIEGWCNRDDLLLAPEPAVVLYGGHTRRAKFVDRPFVPGPNVKILEPKERLNVKFLFYFLAQLPIESRGYADHFPEVRRCSIPAPALAEQRRIAELLDRAEALRAQRRAALAQLDSLTQSLFLDLFGDPPVRKDVGQMVEFGQLATRITYGFTCPMEHLTTGIPIITAKNVRQGYIDFQNCHFASEAQFESLTDKCKPEAGDLLITKDGAIRGRCAVVETRSRFCISQAVALIRPDRSAAIPEYLWGYIVNNRIQHKIMDMDKGVAMPHLQITELAKFPIPLSAISLQREFARRLTAVEKLKTAQRASLAELDALFATLQHRAFRGELFNDNS